MIEIRPMLAAKAPAKIEFPVYASAKLDGIRAIVVDGVAMSRKFLPIPNAHVQNCIGCSHFDGLDGELIVGPANHPNAMQTTMSGVMSRDGEPQFTFWVFDYINTPEVPYSERWERLSYAFSESLSGIPFMKLLPQKLIYTNEDLLQFESDCVEKGYEGAITRKFDSPYKFNRSTAKEQYLLKIKRFSDSEAVIVGFEELMHNANEATIDELGYTKRSSHAENKVGRDMLGAFIVKDIITGIEFNVGTGFSASQREQYWSNRENLKGAIVKYKFFNTGIKKAPRHPVFLGFRHPIDMD